MRIDVLVLDGAFDTGLATLLDCFALAAGLAEGDAAEGEVPALTVRRVGVRDAVRTGHGLAVPLDARVGPDDAPPDVAIVPALGCVTPARLAAALCRDDVRAAADVIEAWHGAGCRVGAACTGTFVLALGGVLDGRRATTTWWLAPEFRKRFPAVELDTDQMVVADADCVTAGAALAHVDLGLWLLRQASPRLARLAARYLLIDDRPSQSAFAMADHMAHDDEVVTRFERWVRGHLHDFSMPEAARACGASARTLQRRVRKVLGRTPIAYVQDVRVEQALHLLRTTDDSLERVAEAVGYADPVTLRALLRRKTGRGIRAIRRGRA